MVPLARYQLTGKTGSIRYPVLFLVGRKLEERWLTVRRNKIYNECPQHFRYMAPEAALGQLYNQSVDTYSFAMVCWELGYGRKPYMGMNMESHRQVCLCLF